MLRISAKDQIANRAAALTNANLTLEAALSHARTPSEKMELLDALQEATRLYMRETMREVQKERAAEREADLAELQEKNKISNEDAHELLLALNNKPRLRRRSSSMVEERACLHARAEAILEEDISGDDE